MRKLRSSFIPGWLFDFVSRLHDDWVNLKVHFMLIKMHAWFRIANSTRALSVPVYRQTDLTPKRVVVSRLHDTVARFRTGMKFSPRWLALASYAGIFRGTRISSLRRGEGRNRAPLETPAWEARLAPAWHFVVVSQPGEWSPAYAKVAGCHVNTPLHSLQI